MASALFTDENIGRRTIARTECDLMVEFKDSAGDWSPALLANMSAKGFRLVGVSKLPAGRSLWMRPTSLEPLAARIRWSAEGAIGCEFLSPLSERTEKELRGLLRTATLRPLALAAA